MAPLNQSEDSPLLPPLFTPRRQTQHRHALTLAAEETGIDMVDVSPPRCLTDGSYTDVGRGIVLEVEG